MNKVISEYKKVLVDKSNTRNRHRKNISRLNESDSTIYYHGSLDKFDKFSHETQWFSTDYDYAKYYVTSTGGYMYSCELFYHNLFDIGSTGRRVYTLLPIKPYKFSKDILDIANKLNINNEELERIVNSAIEEWNVTDEDIFRLKLSTIARSHAFRELLLKRGYDGIKAVEYNVPKSRYCDTYCMYNSEDIKILKVEEVSKNESLKESRKAITFGDLDYAKKTDTRGIQMQGRGTGHFGTGFYFVGADGPYGINGSKFFDYEPTRPIYEIDLDAYKLYKPRDNETAYALHDAFKYINNYYVDDIDKYLFNRFNTAELKNKLYDIGWHLQEDFDDDLSDLDIDLNYDDLSDAEADKKYEDNYKKVAKKFIQDNELERFLNTNSNDLDYWLESSKPGKIEDAIENAIDNKEELIYYVEKGINKASDILRVSKNDILDIVRKAYKNKSQDTLSTQIMKSLGYEGIDVTHLNHDDQGLSGLDNFGYGTVIYDLKPGTFKRIIEPRKKGNIHSKDTVTEDYKNTEETIELLDKAFGQEDLYMWSTYILPNGHFLNPDNCPEYWEEIDEEPVYEHWDFEEYVHAHGGNVTDVYDSCMKMNVTVPYISLPDKAKWTAQQQESFRKIIEANEFQDSLDASYLRDVFDPALAQKYFNNHVGTLIAIYTPMGDTVFDLGVSSADDIIKAINTAYVRGGFNESLDEYLETVRPEDEEDALNESIHLIDENDKNLFYTYSDYDLKNYIDGRMLHGAISVIRICYFASQGLYCFCDAYEGIHDTLEETAREQGIVYDDEVAERYVIYACDEEDYDVIDYSDGIIYDYGDFRVFEVTAPLGKGRFIDSGLYRALGKYKDKYKMINGQIKFTESLKDFYDEIDDRVAYISNASKVKELSDINKRDEEVAKEQGRYKPLIVERIVQLDNGKWQVQSEKGRNLGTYDTKPEAEDRLKDVEMFKHMNESNDEITTTVYTYQSPEVLKQLKDGKTYFADASKGMFSGKKHYNELKRILGLKNSPIFGGIDKDELWDMIIASGLETSNRTQLLELEVPSSEVHKMGYYDWSDYIYYWIDKQEKDSITKEEAENSLRHYSGDSPCQVVIDRIEPSWLVNNEDVTASNPFDKKEIEKDLDDIHDWLMKDPEYAKIYNSKHMNEKLSRGNTFVFNGKNYWCGAVNTLDGVIEEVHTYEEANSYDFHHSLYFSDEQLENMREGISCFFYVYDNEIVVDLIGRNTDVDVNFLKNEINKQIKLIGSINSESLNESKQDIEKFKQWAGEELANRFFAVKDRLDGRQKDIYYWMKLEKDDFERKIKHDRWEDNQDEAREYAHKVAIEALENAIEVLEDTPTRKDINTKGKEGAEKIYEDSRWLVLKINSYEASVKYGKHTQWCITGTNSSIDGGRTDWNAHSDCDFYFFIDKKKDKKYALEYYDNNNWALYNEEDYVEVGEGTIFNNAMDALGDPWRPDYENSYPAFPKVNGLPDLQQAYKDAVEDYNNNYVEKEENKLDVNDYIAEELLSQEQTDRTNPFDIYVTESPYEAKRILDNSKDAMRVFIDENKSLYIIGRAYECTHSEMIELAKKNGYNTDIDDYDENKVCIVYSPKDDYNVNYDFDEVDASEDDYTYMYVYDKFTIFSRYQDFKKFELCKILGDCKKYLVKPRRY